jgi:hypothetical protein
MGSLPAQSDSYVLTMLRRPWRLLRKGAIVIGIVLGVVLGINEVRVRIDAARAMKDKSFAAEFAALEDRLNPNIPATQPSPWTEIERARSLLQGAMREAVVEAEAAQSERDASMTLAERQNRRAFAQWVGTIEADPTRVARLAYVETYAHLSVPPEILAEHEAMLDATARDALSRLRNDYENAVADASAMRNSRRPHWVGYANAQTPLSTAHLKSMSRVIEERVASMVVAREKGDDERFFLCLSQALALLDTMTRQADVTAQSWSETCAERLLDALRGSLIARARAGTLERAWLAKLEATLRAKPPQLRWEEALLAWEAGVRDRVVDIYSDPSSLRFAPLWAGEKLRSAEYVLQNNTWPRRSAWSIRSDRRMGNYRQTQQFVRTWLGTQREGLLNQGPSSLPQAASIPHVAFVVMHGASTFGSADVSRVPWKLRSLEVLLAIELWKAEKGSYPTQLTPEVLAMVPAFVVHSEAIERRLPALLDLASADEATLQRGLRYVLRDGADEKTRNDVTQHPAFCLYTTGFDSVDNGGVASLRPDWLVSAVQRGEDYVLSRTSYR